jgi:hypothetical protein
MRISITVAPDGSRIIETIVPGKEASVQ